MNLNLNYAEIKFVDMLGKKLTYIPNKSQMTIKFLFKI